MPKPPPDTFADTAGIVYDTEAAVRFAHASTGIDEDTCWTFFLSVSRYDLGLGLVGAIEDAEAKEVFGITPGELRERYPVCFPPAHIDERYVHGPLQRLFIALDTGMRERTIRRLQDAEWDYMDRLGLLVRVPVEEEEVVQIARDEWKTVLGGRTSCPVATSPSDWLDVAGLADGACWLDVPPKDNE